MEPNLTDDLITLSRSTGEPPGAHHLSDEDPRTAWLDRLRQEGSVRAGSAQHVSPYEPVSTGLDRFLAGRAKRHANRHTPEVTYVETSFHLEDFPLDPGRVSAIFASLPSHARVGSVDEGWLTISWNEPSTDADRAALAAELAEQAEQAEFTEWKRQKREEAYLTRLAALQGEHAAATDDATRLEVERKIEALRDEVSVDLGAAIPIAPALLEPEAG